MEMQTNIYHCKNPEENPIPRWMGYYKSGKSAAESTVELDLVQQFKNNPDGFFPEFIQKK